MGKSIGTASMSAKVLKAMSIFSGVQALGIICSIVRTKLIALWIGTTGVGLMALFNSVLELVSTTTQLNMRESTVRDISAASGAAVERTAGIVRWWSWRLGLVGMALMIVLSPLLSYFSFDDTSMWWAFAMLSVAVLAVAVTGGEQALMQGRGRLGILAKSSTVAILSGTVVSIPMYYLLGEFSIVPSIIAFALADTIGVLIYREQRSTSGGFKANFKAGLSFLHLGMYLTISSILVTGSQYALISYIGHSSPAYNDVGIYQAGYTLVVKYTSIIFTAMSLEYFPRLVTVAKRPYMASVMVSHELTVIMAVLCPIIVVFIAADELALRILYTAEFMAALPFVTVGICGTVFRALSYSMSYVMVARGDGKAYIITDALSCAIGLTLNILMYSHWGYIGFGIAYVIWYALYTVIVAVVYYRRYGMRLSAPTLRLTVWACGIVLLALALKPLGWWASALALIPAGALVVRSRIIRRIW